MYCKRKKIFTRKLFFNEILQSILLDIYLCYNIRVVNVLNRIFFHTYCLSNVSTIRKKTIFWEHILWLIYTHTHCAHKPNDIKADLNWGFLTLYILNGCSRIVSDLRDYKRTSFGDVKSSIISRNLFSFKKLSEQNNFFKRTVWHYA